MKKVFWTTVCLAMFSMGCFNAHLQVASLSRGVPESFFRDANIEFDESRNVSYTFESRQTDPFRVSEYFPKITPTIYEVNADVNPAFESVLRYYMNSKYSVIGKSGGDYHVDVILESSTYKAEEAGKATASGSSSTGVSATASVHYLKVTTEMTVKVRVNVGGNISEREIMSMGEFTGIYPSADIVAVSFDLAIRGAVSRIDRFLNSTIGASSDTVGVGDF